MKNINLQSSRRFFKAYLRVFFLTSVERHKTVKAFPFLESMQKDKIKTFIEIGKFKIGDKFITATSKLFNYWPMLF